MKTKLPVLDHVLSIPPYPPGRPIAGVAREFGLDPGSIIKLASNENPLGVAPGVRDALEKAAAEQALYPDFNSFDLRQAIASRSGVDIDHVLPACGSSELIQLSARAFLNAERTAVMPRYSFAAYEGAVRAAGATPVLTPLSAWRPDLDALLDAVDDRTAVVYLATPNNPTGAVVAPAEVEAFAAALPEDVVLVLDEAYRDYLSPEERPTESRLLARPNVLLLRTFSKVHALAGLRLGYALGQPEILSVLRRLQIPFSVSAPAQAAAVAALADDGFARRSVEHNGRERARLSHRLDDAGFEHPPSSGNFLMVRVHQGDQVFRRLMRRGVIVRPLDPYGLPEWIRVTVGLAEENDIFVERLEAVMREIQAHAAARG